MLFLRFSLIEPLQPDLEQSESTSNILVFLEELNSNKILWTNFTNRSNSQGSPESTRGG